MRKHVHARGIWGHAPPEQVLSLGALRLLLRPYLCSNLYLDSMPLEYQAQAFLECHLPCSGITEPSLHVFQLQGVVQKGSKRSLYQTAWRGACTKGQILTKEGEGNMCPWCPSVPPPVSIFLALISLVVIDIEFACSHFHLVLGPGYHDWGAWKYPFYIQHWARHRWWSIVPHIHGTVAAL